MDNSPVSTTFTMMVNDTFKTIEKRVEGNFTEKKSRFISLAIPVKSEEEVKEYLTQARKMYYDSTHICYAYTIGPEKKLYRMSDAGEPSGTAGRPILGQINSCDLTNILVIVVRYFGGIKLGVSGLISAYKQAAHEVLSKATIIEQIVVDELSITFDFQDMNGVMQIVKEENLKILSQGYEEKFVMTLLVRKSLRKVVEERLRRIRSLSIK